MRYLAILTALSAAYALFSPAPPTDPLSVLTQQPANAYRWAEYAEAQSEANHPAAAHAAFARALALSPHIPQIYLRHANFLFGLNQPEAALASAAQVLRQVPDFDAALFTSFSRFAPPPAAILKAIGEDRRAVRSYTEYLASINDTDQATTLWNHCNAKKFNDDPLTITYIESLLRNKKYETARDTWFKYKNTATLLFNPTFATRPTGCSLDWRVTPSDQFETTLQPKSAKIQFKGTANVTYANLSQQVVLHPGSYTLSARIKTDDVTTNEGIRLEANGQQTDAITGTQDTTVTLRFTVNTYAPITIRVVRNPSQKFDNKINGTVWLSNLAVTQ